MRNKALIPLILAVALLLAALAWLSLRCADEHYDRLLLAKSASAPNLSPQTVEDFCAEEFLVTYEIECQTAAEAHNYRLPLTMIGTNSCYRQILSYPLLNGGFFSAVAWQAGNKEAVLNATAAFKLFGSYQTTGQTLKMEGANWLIVGVLDDGDAENPRVYVPASISGGNIDSLLVLLDNQPVNADYAINGLKQLGVYEHNYTIVDLSAASAAFAQRLTVALYTVLILIILLLLRRCAGLLFKRLPFYREQLKQLYPRELLTAHFGGLLTTTLAALALLAGIAALVTLALQVLAICLTWKDLLPTGHAWALGSFANKLSWLHTWHPVGMIMFLILLAVLVLILYFCLRQKYK
ncbi:MAG: ABC transporter permease [Firmicutes bacterium]|nr:ABC transporter permease [Bacillota bacterium]